jgi:hypothetical protein
LRFVGSLKERRMLTRALGAVLCLPLCTPGDAFAETTEATGTAALISTVHAAVGTVIEHGAWSSCQPYTLEDPHNTDVTQ